MRGATKLDQTEADELVFQSTHPVRGATRADGLRVGAHDISIHAPREGCDTGGIWRPAISCLFQSTHPVRGATGKDAEQHFKDYVFQSTHPVRGATRPAAPILRAGLISIHAPREGCDLRPRFKFLGGGISIHAPREGCDPRRVARRST